MVRLNRRLNENLEYYDYPTERRYIDYLKETDNAILVDNLVVDIPQIVQRKFVCHTQLCIGAKPLNDYLNKSCCTSFEVRVAPEELERVQPIVDKVEKRYPSIAAELARRDGLWWYFNETDFNKTLEDKDDNGCIFLTPMEDGMIKCALHAVALEEGLEPSLCKPAACTMFPLFVVEVDDEILLTCTCHDTRHVINDDGSYHHFACLAPNDMALQPEYQEMKGVLIRMFGKKVWNTIDREARKRGLA